VRHFVRVRAKHGWRAVPSNAAASTSAEAVYTRCDSSANASNELSRRGTYGLVNAVIAVLSAVGVGKALLALLVVVRRAPAKMRELNIQPKPSPICQRADIRLSPQPLRMQRNKR
jgi:hypothetical protein